MDRRSARAICDSGELLDGGNGVRFAVTRATGASPLPAFAIRYRGTAYAFLNVCAHRAVELDWEPGRFFDIDGRWLMCSTHGALYDPASGACARGACGGLGLTPLAVTEAEGRLWLVTMDGLDLA